MTRRIAVCDDEQTARSQIDTYLHQLQLETGETFEIFYFSSGEELISEMPKDISVILLDIQMGELSGMDAARKLRAEGFSSFLIFITSKTEYAIEGYDVHAYAFLRKPIQYSALKRHLLEAFSQMDEKADSKINIQNGVRVDTIDCEKLLYVEVLRHQCTFVSENGTSEYNNIPLNDIEAKIQKHGFFRCHKSFLVNFSKILRIEPGNITLENGNIIPISKHRYKDFLSAYTEYMGEHL